MMANVCGVGRMRPVTTLFSGAWSHNSCGVSFRKPLDSPGFRLTLPIFIAWCRVHRAPIGSLPGRHLGHLRGACGVSEIKIYLRVLDSNSRLMSCTKWFPFFSSGDRCPGIGELRGLTASWTACKLGCPPFEARSTLLVLYQSRADCALPDNVLTIAYNVFVDQISDSKHWFFFL